MAMEQAKANAADMTQTLSKKVEEVVKTVAVKSKEFKTDAITLMRNPQFQTISISTGAGAIVVGTSGGAFGCASGIVIGGAAGVVPALLTFGLSIPVGAALGGGIGLCSGVVAGGTAGSVGGSLAGYTGYKYRVEIKDGLIYVKTTSLKRTNEARIQITTVIDGVTVRVQTNVAKTKAEAMKAATLIQAKVQKLMVKPKALVNDPKFQCTTAGAAAGTLVCGATGGSAGTLIGAAVGVVPALFTFGLSIPAGAAIGGGIGLCAGGSVGVVGGGAAGYAGYTYRKQIGDSKTKAYKALLNSSDYVKSKICGTGGTA
jgi:hypothetical protein